jgi:hypothetical protein
MVPFGITITCIETADAFAKIFETFIEANSSPNTFITDEQISMTSALSHLKSNNIFKGTHLLDSFHVIRNFIKTSKRKDLAA